MGGSDLVLKRKPQAQNGIVVLKLMMPNVGLIPDLTAASASPRKVTSPSLDFLCQAPMT